jgi:hypothetical protein
MTDEVVPVDDTEDELAEHSAIDYIYAAYYSLEAIESSNPMTKREQEAKKNIQLKAMKILEHCIGELYSEIFGEEESA